MPTHLYACALDDTPADSQLEALRAHRAATGLTPAGEYRDDAAEAWRVPLRDRPGGRDLLARLAPGDAVLLATPMAVSPTLTGYGRLAAALAEVGVALTLATPSRSATAGGQGAKARRLGRLGGLLVGASTPDLSLGVLSRSQRSKAGVAFAKAEGRRTNRFPPVGFKFVRRGGACYAVPDAHELQVIALIVKWRGEGRSWSQIASWLLRNRAKTAGTRRDWSERRIRRAYEAAVAGKLPPTPAVTEPKASGPAAAKEA